jgi:hypothetical protein
MFALSIIVGLVACSKDDDDPQALKKGNTYVGISITLPAEFRAGLRADPTDFNPAGTYVAPVGLNTLDLYILSSDGTTLEASQRYTADQFDAGLDAQGNQVATPKVPFLTTPGDKIVYAILNSPQPILAAAPTATDNISIASGTPSIADLASIQPLAPNFEIIMMTGKSAVTSIAAGVTAEQVKNGQNRVKLTVTRIAARTIVTTTASANVGTLGTISDVTYSVAQGANAVYYNQDTTTYAPHTKSWGYGYVPDASTFATTASTYYDYSDLLNTNAVPANSTTDPRYFLTLPGKFLLETTHQPGVGGGNYKKGNTAYVLIRGKFTPAATADGGAVALDGTFYVGDTDGKIYSSIAAAQAVLYPQDVKTYTEGKVLYFVWLNPDDVAKPYNSPVIRNNIYHININSFRTLGLNWNPLYPNIPTPNPDPQPTNPEEPNDNPIRPEDPLSVDETYMSVDVSVLPWTVHTYGIDL